MSTHSDKLGAKQIFERTYAQVGNPVRTDERPALQRSWLLEGGARSFGRIRALARRTRQTGRLTGWYGETTTSTRWNSLRSE